MYVIWSDGEVWFVGYRENWTGAPLLPIAITPSYVDACRIVEGLLFVIDQTPEFNPIDSARLPKGA